MLTDENICLLIAQVFGPDESAKSSTVIEAVEWAVINGANVINMSLGGGSYSQSSDEYFQEIKKLGILVVAAAGNSGTSTLSYPGMYVVVRKE